MAEDDEDGEFCKHFGEDQEDSMWLSSGSNYSLLSCFENHTFSMLLDPSLDEWVCFLLSLVSNPSPSVNNYITCFDGCRVNPIEEAYLVLKRAFSESDTCYALEKDIKEEEEEEVVTWLLNSTKNDHTSFPSSLTKNSDFHDQISDSERKDLWVSLVNLEEKISWWNSDSKSEFKSNIHLGFPSPSHKSSCGSGFLPSNFSVSSSSEMVHGKPESTSSSDHVREDFDFADAGSNDPLVWPFERKWDWRSDGKWDLYVMSPCRHKKHKDGNPNGEIIPMEFEQGSKTNSSFSSESKNLQLKQINGTKETRRMKSTMPSTLK